MGRGLLWVGILLLCGYLTMDKKDRDRPNILPVASPTVSVGNTAYVEADTLNMRAAPNAESAVLITLGKNAGVEVLDRSGTWWKVKVGDTTGFVNSKYLVESVQEKLGSIFDAGDRIAEYITSQYGSNLDPSDPYAGTTLARGWQEEWDEAHREVMLRMGGGQLPQNALNYLNKMRDGGNSSGK